MSSAATDDGSFQEALKVECDAFNKDYSEALGADPPNAIHGVRGKAVISGQLYRTKEKNIYVVVFVGVLSRSPPVFGRTYMTSKGKPMTTVLIEGSFGSEMVIKTIRAVIDDGSAVDGSDYNAMFLLNVLGELEFDELIMIDPEEGEVKYTIMAPEGSTSSPSATESHKRKGGPETPEPESEVPEPEAECMICMDAKPETLVLPCLHKVVCEKCSVKLRETGDKKTCIYCRATITGISHESGLSEVL